MIIVSAFILFFLESTSLSELTPYLEQSQFVLRFVHRFMPDTVPNHRNGLKPMIAPFQQPHLAALLGEQLASGTFSRVSLFGGRQLHLRMSTAIECARVLSCAHGGGNACRCSSCTKLTTLSYSDLVIVSQRDHRQRIEAALAAFLRQRTVA